VIETKFIDVTDSDVEKSGETGPRSRIKPGCVPTVNDPKSRGRTTGRRFQSLVPVIEASKYTRRFREDDELRATESLQSGIGIG